MVLKENSVILFQGDSITDASRIRALPDSMGGGYAHMVAKTLHKKYAKQHIKCYNRGIYGDTTSDIRARWEEDTLALNPDILSLLIGINDTWRRYDKNRITTPEQFYDNYDYLLKSAKERNPELQIVIMSPFLTPILTWQNTWFEDLNPKIKIVEKMAKKYGAVHIPVQRIFERRLERKMPFMRLTFDGVHPNIRGNRLIKKSWLDYTGL